MNVIRSFGFRMLSHYAFPHHKRHFLILAVCILFGIGSAVIMVRASDTSSSRTESYTWGFQESAFTQLYTYNSTVISIDPSGSGTAQLRRRTDGTYPVAGLNGWAKRKAITISNTTTELHNYQMQVVIDYDSDMLSTYDDIRFTDSDGYTLLPFWLEQSTSTQAIYWVQMPVLAAETTTTIYVYYGNRDAVSASSIEQTFIFGDDFSSAALSSNWTEVTAGGALPGIIQNGLWSKSCAGDCRWTANSDIDAGAYIADPGGTWEAETKLDSINNVPLRNYGMMLYESARNGYEWGYANSVEERYQGQLLGSARFCMAQPGTVPSYLKIRKLTDNGSGQDNLYELYLSFDGVNWQSCELDGATFQTMDNMSNVGLFIGDESSDTEETAASFDQFFVKQYVTPEPMVGEVGEEQSILSYDAFSITSSLTGFHPFVTFVNSLGYTAGENSEGDIGFQFGIDTNDDGVDAWYYYNGTQWSVVDMTVDATQVNTLDEVNDHLDTLVSDIGEGELFVRAFLLSNGTQPVAINDITLNYQTASSTGEDIQNHAPIFSGALPSVSFFAGSTTATVFALGDYFSDSDNDALSYRVSGNKEIDVYIDEQGRVSFSADASFVGQESLRFSAEDPSGLSDTSNTITVAVAEMTSSQDDGSDTTPDTDTNTETGTGVNDVPLQETREHCNDPGGITANQSLPISHITGRARGRGRITVVSTNSKIIRCWDSFPIGGVVPRLGSSHNTTMVYSVKRRLGSTLHVEDIYGHSVLRRRLSPKLHVRKIAIGQLDTNTNTQEIVLATRRGSTLYFKIFRFDPGKRRLHTIRLAEYRGLHLRKHFHLQIRHQRITLQNKKNRTIFVWKF